MFNGKPTSCNLSWLQTIGWESFPHESLLKITNTQIWLGPKAVDLFTHNNTSSTNGTTAVYSLTSPALLDAKPSITSSYEICPVRAWLTDTGDEQSRKALLWHGWPQVGFNELQLSWSLVCLWFPFGVFCNLIFLFCILIWTLLFIWYLYFWFALCLAILLATLSLLSSLWSSSLFLFVLVQL